MANIISTSKLASPQRSKLYSIQICYRVHDQCLFLIFQSEEHVGAFVLKKTGSSTVDSPSASFDSTA